MVTVTAFTKAHTTLPMSAADNVGQYFADNDDQQPTSAASKQSKEYSFLHHDNNNKKLSYCKDSMGRWSLHHSRLFKVTGYQSKASMQLPISMGGGQLCQSGWPP